MSRLFGKEVRRIEVSEPEYNDGGFQNMEKPVEPHANFTCEVDPGVFQVFFFDYENNILYLDVTEFSEMDGVEYQKLKAITKGSRGEYERRLWRLTRPYRKRIRPGFLRKVFETVKMFFQIHFGTRAFLPEDIFDDEPLISEEVRTAKSDAAGVPLVTKVLEMSKPRGDARGEGKLDPFDGAEVAKYYTGLS